MMILIGMLSSAVLFPTVSGGGIVLTLLAALFIYHKKFPACKWQDILWGLPPWFS